MNEITFTIKRCQNKIWRALLDMNILLCKKQTMIKETSKPKVVRSWLSAVAAQFINMNEEVHLFKTCDWLLETRPPCGVVALHELTCLSWLNRNLQDHTNRKKTYVLFVGQNQHLREIRTVYILVMWLRVFGLGTYSNCDLYFGLSLREVQACGLAKCENTFWGCRKISHSTHENVHL